MHHLSWQHIDAHQALSIAAGTTSIAFQSYVAGGCPSGHIVSDVFITYIFRLKSSSLFCSGEHLSYSIDSLFDPRDRSLLDPS
jgi:hypothetical protein